MGGVCESNVFMLKSQTWWWIFTLNMPNGFDKTGHGRTDAVIAWDEFKPVLHLGYFWE